MTMMMMGLMVALSVTLIVTSALYMTKIGNLQAKVSELQHEALQHETRSEWQMERFESQLERRDLRIEAFEKTYENPVLAEVHRKLAKQTEKGLKKYGHTVRPEQYRDDQWLLHLQEELIDAAAYAESLMQKRNKQE
ncbi:hypothetical protein [Sporosarcina trichiuri]|uniref:hypothetical protein n=1 Tax=Sporosarcina trichiuri TaxID=3056445 RepID=UPI0025B373AE|nr:hypothetical protein [Sporosarcina sp. 0.2-SM1T-5]WJY27433.1 hypothetical protein QWT68_15550 [Sporosarcina sp. 0.2-SM1T-5]WJY27453.1 hypothetical protein QWT68_00070 [Sporosarcina sp. 0.2-SM1T-5]